MKFTYNSGQRPLDGYTLKRGIGRGGFGEVYYAVSDGGKEVALKLVRGGNSEVELRGMQQCLNLKHPHLVSLFDLKTDAQGDQWVVMEYIAGETLNNVLLRHPNGLPRELAQQWFVGLARAVSYLHDHGIVHRDLKPGNVFIENGLVKVGDYGLCKFMSGSQHNAQTQSVGTVHYMAPEISTGNYNKQVDIYAAGVILYEMLTGRVPFDGESAGEILMKHLTAPPDLSKLPADYVTVVGKALAKNPQHRYTSLVEMARDVEGAGIPVIGPAHVVPEPRRAAAPRVKQMAVRRPIPAEVIPDVLPVPSLRGQVAELSGSMVLAAILAVVTTTVYAALSQGRPQNELFQTFFLTVAASWAVLVPAKFWASRRGDSWTRRVVMTALGMGIGCLALWVDGWSPRASLAELNGPGGTVVLATTGLVASGPNAAGYLSYFALAFFALRWWKLADRRRGHRFSFAPVVAAAFWALALSLVWHDPWNIRGLVVLTTASAIVQVVSPWDQPPPAAARRMRLRYA